MFRSAFSFSVSPTYDFNMPDVPFKVLKIKNQIIILMWDWRFMEK